MFWHEPSPVRLSQDPFKFRALENTTTIRLIKACRQKLDDCIACKIYHSDVNQQESVKYHALSYVWGNETTTKQVYLRDQGTVWHPLPLHENLWRFLDYAWRHKDFNRLFWTDRLCLDQNRPEEISQQVPRMHAIYRNAALCVVWLQSQKPNQAHRSLIKIVRWSGVLKPMPKIWDRVFRKELRWDRDEDVWNQLMRNDYWQRAWIVQEVVVAKKVCVTFENVSLDFDKLPALLERFRWPNVDQYEEPAQEPAFWALFNMRAGGGRLPLWRILMNSDEYQSSRPADRVYGLLGMVADHDDGSSPVDNIEVDYQKPITHVLLDAAFESSPPLEWYDKEFLPLVPGEAFSEGDHKLHLRSYVASGRTTQRHRDLARFAIQTLDAFEIIDMVSYKFLRLRDMTAGLFRSAAEPRLKPTFAQSAALIGILIAQGYKVYDNSPISHYNAAKARRHRMNLASSPWRCNAHRSLDGGHTGLGSNEVATGAIEHRWDREIVVEACGEHSHICDGSTLTFEIPQIGLRVLLEPAINSKDDGCLSLHLNTSSKTLMYRNDVGIKLAPGRISINARRLPSGPGPARLTDTSKPGRWISAIWLPAHRDDLRQKVARDLGVSGSIRVKDGDLNFWIDHHQLQGGGSIRNGRLAMGNSPLSDGVQ